MLNNMFSFRRNCDTLRPCCALRGRIGLRSIVSGMFAAGWKANAERDSTQRARVRIYVFANSRTSKMRNISRLFSNTLFKYLAMTSAYSWKLNCWNSSGYVVFHFLLFPFDHSKQTRALILNPSEKNFGLVFHQRVDKSIIILSGACLSSFIYNMLNRYEKYRQQPDVIYDRILSLICVQCGLCELFWRVANVL